MDGCQHDVQESAQRQSSAHTHRHVEVCCGFCRRRAPKHRPASKVWVDTRRMATFVDLHIKGLFESDFLSLHEKCQTYVEHSHSRTDLQEISRTLSCLRRTAWIVIYSWKSQISTNTGQMKDQLWDGAATSEHICPVYHLHKCACEHTTSCCYRRRLMYLRSKVRKLRSQQLQLKLDKCVHQMTTLGLPRVSALSLARLACE